MNCKLSCDKPPVAQMRVSSSFAQPLRGKAQSSRSFLVKACLVVAAIAFVSQDNKAVSDDVPKRPNVVVILADDQGWGDLSCNGNPNLSTPHIDSLARDGARVEHFYVCAVCSPTRAEFLTGRYHTRMGVYSTSTGGERFDAGEQTIAEVFRQSGYATAAYGKWHSGMQWPYHPNARGFDDYYGFCSGHWGNYFSPMLEHNGKIVKGEGFLVDDLTNHAIEFIDAHREESFFVYLPLNTPHSPMQVPDPFWDKFKDKDLVPDPAKENQKKNDVGHSRAALAMCENIDFNVGRLLSHLESSGLADDTIVVYFSDNGPNGARFNGGMRGRKGSTHEGGLRSPLLIRYPRKIRPGTRVTQVSAAIDLLPTLSELTGTSHDSRLPLDGQSIASLLVNPDSVPPKPLADRIVFSAWNGKVSARDQRYRMQFDGGLYDIENDPGERMDLREQKPEEARRLGDAMAKWIEQTEPRKSSDALDRPITMGHPQAVWDQLPARDAEPIGGMVRSNRYPNCTYMTNWTSPDDAIVWDADVLSDGEFEVVMYYACEPSSVGSVVRLEFGEQAIESVIQHANVSDLVGAADDRVVRQEGYVKDWRPMNLGTIRLAAGRAMLKLSASKVNGGEVAEMRLLMLKRLPSAEPSK
ncbi:Arylsulfatase [Rubripirellula amarantea]|uniref:Arylsulfatase n=1 Tax=Rubripirellula amarantea TaxID=2527999 RepID=A0A5C5WYS4_9BACT|nr:arylsulfatase [Rubripirellula amarantea]TWT55042.1 Arylsulfatase [Rubripirellula amarantea]